MALLWEHRAVVRADIMAKDATTINFAIPMKHIILVLQIAVAQRTHLIHLLVLPVVLPVTTITANQAHFV